MRWANPDRLPNIKAVVDRYHILDRVINRNRAKMWAAGSPCTYWRNSSITRIGTLPKGLTKCYCWATPAGGDTQQSAPDRRHFLCMGTGYLAGYQKYGYEEIVVSTPSALTVSSANLIISGERSSSYTLSGTSLSETLTTERFSLTRFKAVDHFMVNDSFDVSQNKLEYEYSLDDINWIALSLVPYNTTPLANRQATGFSLPTSTGYIRFRVRLRKRTATSAPPKWNSIRFRYRKQRVLNEIDPRFGIDIPAFMAAREQQKRTIEQGEHGWTTKYPMEWWTLPEVDILNADIIVFLVGSMAGYHFETKNLREIMYGQFLQLTHKTFETAFIRDTDDLLGITQYLI